MKLFGVSVAKPLVWVLVAVALVSGGITTALIFHQMIPDVLAQGPDGPGYVMFSGGDWVEYEDSWEAVLKKDEPVRLDLEAVNVVVEPSNGDKLEASFTGQVRPYRDGTLPRIAQGNGFGFVLEREKGRNVQVMNNNEGAIRGVLTVKVPKNIPLQISADLFSGSVSVRDYNASSLNLHTSSGSITVERVTTSGDAEVFSFSGSMELHGLTAKDGLVDTSSGAVNASDLAMNSLAWAQFSGDMAASNLQVAKNCDISSSSGRVNLTGFSAASMRLETFSGNVILSAGTIGGTLLVDGSSSAVRAETIKADTLDITTFSGDINLAEITVNKLTTDTSSGALNAALLTPADIKCISFSGAVTLAAPQDFAFSLDAETFSGNIELGYPVTISGGVSKKAVSGKVGSGGYSVEVETSSGNISINPAS